jgi:biopolymer transport protein ExbB
MIAQMQEQMQEQLYAILDYISIGGRVMIPIIVLSLIMWMLIIHRFFFLRRMYFKNMSRRHAGFLIENNQLPDERQYRGITALFVAEFIRNRSGKAQIDKYILDETVMALSSRLDHQLAIIGVLAGVAPLLGLLGTVTGMISTFDIISWFGTGNARAMAGGISEALITTQTGLFVAIPGLYMLNFLNRRALALKHRISSLGIYLKRHL